jgi:hypothetical protein
MLILVVGGLHLLFGYLGETFIRQRPEKRGQNFDTEIGNMTL